MILGRSYDEIMEKVHISDEARERILSNVMKVCAGVKRSKIIGTRNFNRYLIAAAVIVCIISIPVSFYFRSVTEAKKGEEEIYGNGIVECASAKALSEKLGFSIYDIKNLPFEVNKTTYNSCWGDFAEIQYEENENNFAIYRMKAGDEDPSGDFYEYSLQDEISIEDMQITLKGNEDTYNLAIWTYKGYSYSLYFSEGISEETFQSVLEGIELYKAE